MRGCSTVTHSHEHNLVINTNSIIDRVPRFTAGFQTGTRWYSKQKQLLNSPNMIGKTSGKDRCFGDPLVSANKAWQT